MFKLPLFALCFAALSVILFAGCQAPTMANTPASHPTRKQYYDAMKKQCEDEHMICLIDTHIEASQFDNPIIAFTPPPDGKEMHILIKNMEIVIPARDSKP